MLLTKEQLFCILNLQVPQTEQNVYRRCILKGYPKLKALLVERGIKQREISETLGITLSTFNNKLNGIGDFSISDVKKICKKLEIEADIFFA